MHIIALSKCIKRITVGGFRERRISNKRISNKLHPNISLDEVRNIYDSGYAGRAKLREMGIGITLDGKAWDRNGAYIGEI